MALRVRDHMAIQFATRRYKFEGVREAVVLEELGMSAPRFWQYVNRLIDRPDALAEYPAEVHRLLRLRNLRRRARATVA